MSPRLRALDASAAEDIALVASRMQSTLIEVLGRARGESMYSMDWLIDRVNFHLDPARSTGAVFVAEAACGDVLGHTIVRVEREDARTFGLFSTTFVVPEARSCGVARLLVDEGERWMSAARLPEAVTYTSSTNTKLIRLFERRGYVLAPANHEMVQLSRSLNCASGGPS